MLFSAKIIPEAKRNLVTALSPTRLKVEVKEEARGNLANIQAIALLADHFNLPKGKVKIIRGHHKPQKIVSINKEEK